MTAVLRIAFAVADARGSSKKVEIPLEQVSSIRSWPQMHITQSLIVLTPEGAAAPVVAPYVMDHEGEKVMLSEEEPQAIVARIRQQNPGFPDPVL